MLSFTVDDHSHGAFLRDGAPHQLISGAVHYFRIPPELWRDRLERLIAMGCTTVETYVAWNAHQPYRDTAPDFTGQNDLGAFCDLAAELDLDILVRPGPFICAEWDFGGLPSWLMNDPAVIEGLRTADAAWLDVVGAWFEALVPVIAERQVSRGGRVIAVQVENEYGSYGNDTGYLEALADQLAELGIDVPLFTSDGPSPLMLRGGTLDHCLATVNFGSRQAEAFATLREFRPESPTMCMEFWNGWFDHWGGKHHTRSAETAADELDQMLSGGHSVNFYMAHGGSNPAGWAGANAVEGPGGPVLQPTITSYDYDSPIAEDGALTDKFWAFRRVIEAHRGVTLPEPPAPAPRLDPRPVPTTAGPSLTRALDAVETVHSPTPLSLEQLGIHHGVVRYRTAVAGTGRAPLHLDGLGDLARVSCGDQVRLVSRLGIDEAYGPDCELDLAEDGVLDVEVASLGRVNFGPHLGRMPKGVRAIRVDHQHQFGIDHAALELHSLPALAGLPADAPADGPGFHTATVTIDAPADAFLALPGWHVGYVYLNGHNLGRYWSIGPQRTLYAPAPWWRAGDNEIVVCELDRPGSGIEVVAGPDLGPTD